MILSDTVALTATMGVLLVAVVVIGGRLRVSRSRPDRSNAPHQRSDEDIPRGWIAGFLGLVILAGGATLVFLDSGVLGQFATQTAGVLIGVVLAGIFCGYLISGLYVSLRSHGRQSAEATGVALWLLGLLAIATIAGQLVLAG